MPSGTLPDAGLHSGVDFQFALPRLVRAHRITRAGALAAAVALVAAAPMRGGLAVLAGLPAGALAAARAVALGALVVLGLLAARSRRRLRGLPAPLRYGFSVGSFVPTPGSTAPAATAALHLDLAHRLAARHPRLGLGGRGDGDPGAHTVAVAGSCRIRPGQDGEPRVVEVQPSVRIAPPSSVTDAATDRTFETGAAASVSVVMAGDDLAPDEYAVLLDRVRASVAEELYRQLHDHASDELSSLPTRYLRGRSLWHEAEDHAGSGTTRAHDRARRLYDLAAERLDPAPRPLPPTPVRRAVALAAIAAAHLSALLRRAGARAIPRLADRDVAWARCRLGAAAVLLDHRVLSGLPGRELTPVYEAQPLVRSALSRLASLPAGAPGREAGLFDGTVLLAFTLVHLGDRPAARRLAETARAADPSRADRDPTFLLVAGELDERPASRIRSLRRAATLGSAAAARWRVAQELERAWRLADELDPIEAFSVLAAYREVLVLDPGHLGAWASIAYVHWLQDQLTEADTTLASGWRARPLGAGTFRTELALGRARVAAESGRIDAAYRHARDAVAGLLAEGVPQLPDGEPASYGAWSFARSPAVVDRCRRYREGVSRHLEQARDSGRWSPAVLDSVDGFVWLDLGECLRYAGRSDEAEQAFVRATAADPGCVLAQLHLSDLYRRRGDEERAIRAAAEIARREPSWETGALARALNAADRAAVARRRAAQAARAAADREADRSPVEGRRLLAGPAPAPADPPGAEVIDVVTAACRAESDGSEEATPPTSPRRSRPDGHATPPSGTAVERMPAPSPGAVLATALRRLDEEIAGQRRRSERQAARARHAATALRATVPAVVPHGWLWHRPDGDVTGQRPDGNDSFDWLALNPPDPRREHRWERQLDERHAVALYLYGHTWLRHPPEDVRVELAFQRAATLLRCVRERFLPRNHAVVVDLLLAEAAVGAPDRVTDLVAEITGGTDEEAKPVFADVLAAEHEFPPDWQADIVAAACEQERCSPELSAWLADRALHRVLPRVDGDRASRLTAAARAAFRRGLHSRRAADLLVAGDGLSDLCDAEHAARAYRAALEAAPAGQNDVATGAEADVDDRTHPPPDPGPGGPEPANRAALRLAAVEFAAGVRTPPDGHAPGEGGRTAPTRAEIAGAIGDELARGRRRPCADAASLDAGYEDARLWVAAEREKAARAEDAGAWRDAEAARLALVATRPPAPVAPWHDDAVAAPRHASARAAVEARPDLLPGGTATVSPSGVAAGGEPPSDSDPFRTAVDDARRLVARRFGVALPEVGWRDDAEGLAPGSYRIVVDGVPVATGRLERGAGHLGRQLTACLQDRLASFLGVQEVRDALEDWVAAGDPGRVERASAVAPLCWGTELRTLTVCLRALLDERVPIHDLGSLVDTYRGARAEEAGVGQTVARLRRSVRDDLPGNAPGWRRLRLPDEIEDDIRRRVTGGELPAIPPAGLATLLTALQAAIGEAADRPVAVVTEASLRLPVRWLVAREHPRVPVLADDEVVTEIRLPDDEPMPSSPAQRSGGEWTR